MSDEKIEVGTVEFNKRLAKALGLEGEHVTKLTVLFSVDACPMLLVEKLTEKWRAEALLGLFGDMPAPTKWLPVITDDFAIKSVPIGANDKLVVRTDARITLEGKHAISESLKAWAPNHDVIILEPGMSLEIVSDVTHLNSSTREFEKVKV